MNTTKIEKLRKIIAEKNRQYNARQAHIPEKERELKENFAKGRITEKIYDLGKKQLEEYKMKAQEEFDEICVIEKEIEDELNALPE